MQIKASDMIKISCYVLITLTPVFKVLSIGLNILSLEHKSSIIQDSLTDLRESRNTAWTLEKASIIFYFIYIYIYLTNKKNEIEDILYLLNLCY